MLYNVLIKVPRVGVADSVVAVIIVAQVIGRLTVEVQPKLQRLYEILARVQCVLVMHVELETQCADLVDSAFENVKGFCDRSAYELELFYNKVATLQLQRHLASKEATLLLIRLWNFQGEKKLMNKEIKRLLKQGFGLHREIEGLESATGRNR